MRPESSQWRLLRLSIGSAAPFLNRDHDRSRLFEAWLFNTARRRSRGGSRCAWTEFASDLSFNLFELLLDLGEQVQRAARLL